MDREVIRICRLRLEGHILPKLAACLESLRGVQINQSGALGHSVEGLVNHILGHLQLAARWAGEGLNGVAHVPPDICAFFPESGATIDDLIRSSHETFARTCQALLHLELNEAEPAGLDLQRLLHLVEHISYHLGQIVLLAKTATGKSFDFAQSGLNEAQLREQVRRLEEHDTKQPQ